ncbi:MAG: DUF4214 domain-containing protein [Eubacterium sp.]|nr:DUF4214 domain-containing protein [Eubacterium sp.]
MKTKSFKFISFLMTLIMALSMTPALAVSAREIDHVGLSKVSLKVKNTDAYYYDGSGTFYCLAGERPTVSASINGLSEGNYYDLDVELYKEGYYVTGDSYGHLSGKPYSITLPKLSVGRYMVRYTFSGKDISEKSFNYSIYVMDKNAYSFCDNLFNAFGVPKTAETEQYKYMNAYSLSIDDVMSRMVITMAYNKSNINNVSNEDFVNALYKGILQREADKGGYAYWLNKLNSGKKSRAEVTAAFMTSDEFKNVTCKNFNIPW